MVKSNSLYLPAILSLTASKLSSDLLQAVITIADKKSIDSLYMSEIQINVNAYPHKYSSTHVICCCILCTYSLRPANRGKPLKRYEPQNSHENMTENIYVDKHFKFPQALS